MLEHLDGVFRLAVWLTRDRVEAEDMVQDTYTQAIQSFHRFEPGSNARGWLFAILRHSWANRRRAARRSIVEPGREAALDLAPAVDDTPQDVTEEEVLDALSRLPDGYQDVVLLADVEDLSYREIASVLSLPIGTVMSRLHRARRLLRASLAGYAANRGIPQVRSASGPESIG